MNRIKNRRIKKLRRGHIWPSILVCLFSIIISCISLDACLTFFLQYMLDDRLSQSYESTLQAGSMIDDRMQQGDTVTEAVEYMKNNAGNFDTIYVLDKNNEILAGFGEQSFDLDHPIDLLIFDQSEYKLYLDKNAKKNIMDSYKKYSFSIDDAIAGMVNSGIYDEELIDSNIFETSYYLETPLASQNERVIVKCSLCLSYRNVLYMCIFAFTPFIFLVMTILLMFFNILINFINQRRTIKLLYMDPVTGGDNMLSFTTAAPKIISMAAHTGRPYAIIDFSFMKYNAFCTYHGARAGENLLEHIDGFLRSKLNKREKCARSSDSSFVVLIRCSDDNKKRKQTTSPDNMIEEYQKYINKRIQSWMSGLKDIPQLVHRSHGIFQAGVYIIEPYNKQLYRRRNVDVSQMYSHAVAAKSVIESDESDQIAYFTDKLIEDQRWEHDVEESMQYALDNEEFKVYIQPKYNPVTEELAGAEALVRWINPQKGFISPGKFIPIFEKNGFITKLDDYMISHVAKLQAEWLKKGKKVVPVSVNVSRAHFAQEDLADHICRLVDEYDVPHHLIEIELTESAFFDDRDALLTTVRKLQEYGFEVSMDDFGSGYSSLNSLKDLPLNVLKLDADFFRGEDSGSRGEIVISEAIHLAKSLNMRIVAEGVEKKDQVDFLAGQNCDMIQGFYFAKPMPAQEYEEKMQ